MINYDRFIQRTAFFLACTGGSAHLAISLTTGTPIWFRTRKRAEEALASGDFDADCITERPLVTLWHGYNGYTAG